MHRGNVPTFFVLGAAKAGTTSLYYYLKQHPQIFLPKVKEPHFFDDDRNYCKGLDAYLEQHFKGAVGYRARGEATPAYLRHYRKVIPRMIDVYRETPPQFIVVLRDPVSRAWSHYLHRVRNGTETETFERALELEESRLEKDESSWAGYFSDGLYSSQIEVWLRNFPRELFLFFLNEDLRFDANSLMKRIFNFLRVDESVAVTTHEKQNTASVAKSVRLMQFLSQPSIMKAPFRLILPYSTRLMIKQNLRQMNWQPASVPLKIDDRTAKLLRSRYVDDIKRLEQIIGRDLSGWLEEP